MFKKNRFDDKRLLNREVKIEFLYNSFYITHSMKVDRKGELKLN